MLIIDRDRLINQFVNQPLTQLVNQLVNQLNDQLLNQLPLNICEVYQPICLLQLVERQVAARHHHRSPPL